MPQPRLRKRSRNELLTETPRVRWQMNASRTLRVQGSDKGWIFWIVCSRWCDATVSGQFAFLPVKMPSCARAVGIWGVVQGCVVFCSGAALAPTPHLRRRNARRHRVMLSRLRRSQEQQRWLSCSRVAASFYQKNDKTMCRGSAKPIPSRNRDLLSIRDVATAGSGQQVSRPRRRHPCVDGRAERKLVASAINEKSPPYPGGHWVSSN
jgi:hypothetical protein